MLLNTIVVLQEVVVVKPQYGKEPIVLSDLLIAAFAKKDFLAHC